jgi:oligoendopeptidase F
MEKEVEQLEEAKKKYMEALRVYKDRLRAVGEIMQPVEEKLKRGLISLDEALDAEEEAEEQAGLWQAYDELREARKKLLETAKPMLLKRAKKPEDVEAIEKTFSCKLISIQEELIDTILQWDPRLDEKMLRGGG